MTIKIKKATKDEIADFDIDAWHGEDIKHYGERVNWVEKEFAFKVIKDEQIVGTAKGKFEAGVIYLQTIIVSKNHRRKGVGKTLIDKILDWAMPLHAHKIILFTMPEWDSCKFYESIGFKQSGTLPNHYLKRDFVIYSKDLS